MSEHRSTGETVGPARRSSRKITGAAAASETFSLHVRATLPGETLDIAAGVAADGNESTSKNAKGLIGDRVIAVGSEIVRQRFPSVLRERIGTIGIGGLSDLTHSA